MADITDYILQRQAALAENRSPWEEMWQEAAEHVLPRQAGFSGSGAPGARRRRLIHDSTAPLALERFAAALESVLTPRNQKWHRLRFTGNQAAGPAVDDYLDEVNRCLFSLRYSPRANFANQLHEVYLSLGTFGTGGLFIDYRPGRGLSYRALHLADLFLAEDYGGRIDTVFRRFELTARQALAEFGSAGLPADLVRAAGNPRDMERTFTFIHAVMPRADLDCRRADFKGMPYASFYVAQEGRRLVREGGYHSFPYAISRYVTAPREIYGRSPAIMALPDIKQVNEMEATLIKAGQKAVDPPLLLTDDDVLSPFSLRPGALNYGGLGEDGRQRVVPLNTGADLPLGFEMLEQKRKVINDAFLVSLFMVLVESPAMTATEALLRSQEKGALLAPAMGRQQSELLGPLIRREIDLLTRAGELPPPPPELAYQQPGVMEIEYESPMTRAQRAEEAVGLQRLLEGVAPLAQSDPAVMNLLDGREIMKLLMNIHGVSPKVMKAQSETSAAGAAGLGAGPLPQDDGPLALAEILEHFTN